MRIFICCIIIFFTQKSFAQQSKINQTISNEISFALQNTVKENLNSQYFYVKISLDKNNQILGISLSDNLEISLRNQLLKNLNSFIIQKSFKEEVEFNKNILIPIICHNIKYKAKTFPKMENLHSFNGKILEENLHVMEPVIFKYRTDY